jgi:CrcB protein
MLRTILLIGFGGGLGSIFRYLTTLFVNKYYSLSFPLATFITNVLGCLIIGLLLGAFEKYQLTNPDLKFLFVTGFCGGYTTFSTFANENVNLFHTNNSAIAFAYIGLSVLTGLFSVWLGLSLTKI